MKEKLNTQNWKIQLKNCTNENLKNNLPLNEDNFDLIIQHEKLNFNISSGSDYLKYVEYCAKQYMEDVILSSSGKISKFKAMDIYNLLMNYNLVYYTQTLYIENNEIKYQNHYWVKNYENTKKLFKPANLPCLINETSYEMQIPNIIQLLSTTKNLFKKLDPTIKSNKLNIAPKNLLLFNNGILNIDTFEFSTNIDELGTFDFTSKIDYKLLHPDDTIKNYYDLIDKWFHTWTNNDYEQINQLKQLAINVLKGDDDNKYIIIVSENGRKLTSGQTTYLQLLQYMTIGQSKELDIQLLKYDRYIKDINDNLKLIVGYDLNPELKITDKLASRINDLINHKPIVINKTFNNIKSNCVKIQSADFIPDDLINNIDNLKIIHWKNNDFSKYFNSLDQLDNLMENSDFIESFISYIFTK